MLQRRILGRLAGAWGMAALLLTGCGVPPAAPGAAQDDAWVAAWGSAQLAQHPPALAASAPAGAKEVPAVWREPLRDVSLRQVVRVSAEGTALRVRVSNVFGSEPLRLGAVSVALVQAGPAMPVQAGSTTPAQPGSTTPAQPGSTNTPEPQPVLQAGTLRALTFGGRRELTLAPGTEAGSDDVPLAVPRLADLVVQMHVATGAAPATVHPGSRINGWAVPGNRLDAADAAAWADAVPRQGWWYLAAVDVRPSRPQPVLVAIGDSITDGYGVPSGSHLRWTDALARRLQAAGRTAAVINTGIGGNRLLRDGLGPNVVSRFDRDVLGRSGVTHAVVLIGVNDLGVSHRNRSTTAESRATLLAELKAGFSAIARRAHERGVCLIGATVLPYSGSGYYKPGPENEADRVALNDWMRRSGIFDAVLDFDAILRDPARPTHLRAEFDIDGLHPNMEGHRIMAEGFPLEVLDRRCPAQPAAAVAAPTAPTTTTAMPPTFANPVLSGFASDPSVCRSGEDYYLVTSTFEYLPGLPVYHSRDLVHWRLLGNALARESQISFTGRKSSQAIFAPTIRCEGGMFYIVTTDVGGIGSFLLTARDPAGPWSDPVPLPEKEFTMDPSLFFDDDGTVYYTRHGGGQNGGIYQARIDVRAGKLLDEPRLVWRGMGGIWPEGPHLFKRNGWYYLLISEGGTSYDHRLTMARSRSPWGPFEPHPDNPVLTHRNRPGEPFQALGHGDFVATPQGAWWTVLLAIRSQTVAGGRHHHIGRETLLAPVHWRDDDWPDVGQGRALPQPQSTQGLPGWRPWPVPAVRETFAAERPLPPHWVFLRTLAQGRWSLSARPGHLRLLGSQAGLDVVGTPAFVGRRQERLTQRFATQLDLRPVAEGDAAGLALRQNEQHHVLLRVTGVGQRRAECAQHDARGPQVLATAPVPEGPLQLQVLADPQQYTLSWRHAAGQGPWQTLCTVPTYQLSTETAKGFTGVYMGLYAVSGSAAPAVADFAWVDFEDPGL